MWGEPDLVFVGYPRKRTARTAMEEAVRLKHNGTGARYEAISASPKFKNGKQWGWTVAVKSLS